MARTQRLRELFRVIPKDRLKPIYKRHRVSFRRGNRTLIGEIRRDGSNSLVTVFRGGRGVRYSEIVRDVAKRFKIRPKRKTIPQIEREILCKIFNKYYEKASQQEKRDVRALVKKVGGEKALQSLQSVGFKVTSLIIANVKKKAIAEILKKIILKTLGKEAAKAAGRAAGMAVPFLNAVLVGWTIVDIAGPAFRKTIPTVLEIALLRMEFGE